MKPFENKPTLQTTTEEAHSSTIPSVLITEEAATITVSQITDNVIPQESTTYYPTSHPVSMGSELNTTKPDQSFSAPTTSTTNELEILTIAVTTAEPTQAVTSHSNQEWSQQTTFSPSPDNNSIFPTIALVSSTNSPNPTETHIIFPLEMQNTSMPESGSMVVDTTSSATEDSASTVSTERPTSSSTQSFPTSETVDIETSSFIPTINDFATVPIPETTPTHLLSTNTQTTPSSQSFITDQNTFSSFNSSHLSSPTVPYFTTELLPNTSQTTSAPFFEVTSPYTVPQSSTVTNETGSSFETIGITSDVPLPSTIAESMFYRVHNKFQKDFKMNLIVSI